MDRSHILVPFSKAEACSTAEAARVAGVKPRTMREWCHMYPIGRFVVGHWKVSRVALQMLLDGDDAALRAYASGDRTSALVTEYFDAFDIPLPTAGLESTG